MLTKFLLLLTLVSQLYSEPILNKIYYIDSNQVMLSHIIPHPKNDIKLFNIDKNRYSKKITSKRLINILKNHGYESYISEHRFIKFIKKSDIDTSKMKNRIKEFYLQHYANIKIKKILVEPRGYVKSLPQNYSVSIPSRAHLSNLGIIHIKTLKNKKFFFNYTVDATINSFTARQNIKKGSELSPLNTKKANVVFSKYRATPLQVINKSTLQAKNHIKKDSVITTRDVVMLDVVKRNSMVIVILNSSNIAITFSAKALQNGKSGDIINIQKSNGKRLKARVIGRNRVEIQ
ncbi:MAG: flagellar basal body P-ring formation chaperone FlgA [Campylobacterota bacterium]|nr:flagellar basal body P-ring formation chaperone FlgA [Campylobacterota bacterium]